MGNAIEILSSLFSSIKGVLSILLPELGIAFFSFKVVKEQDKQLKVFFWSSAILLVIYSCLFGFRSLLTKNLLQHEYADYKNGTKWDVKIYDNKTLSGTPIFDGNIWGLPNGLQIDWGFASPKQNLPQDEFSADFSTDVNFTSGSYCFVLLVDDGANLIVDGNSLISHYHGYTPEAVFKKPLELSSGTHKITLQYYDEINTAKVHVFWYELHGDECTSINEP